MAGQLTTLSILDGAGTAQTIRVWDESGAGTGPFYPAHIFGGTAWTSVFGVAGVPFTSADQHSAAASVTDAPTSGQKLVIDELTISVDTTMNVRFKEETTGTTLFGPYYILANTTIHLKYLNKRKLATADKKLQVLTSVSGNITVGAHYHSEV